jgi:hypothetical protein
MFAGPGCGKSTLRAHVFCRAQMERHRFVFSIIYDRTNDIDFHRHIIRRFNQFNNLNYYIERCKPYNYNGRSQTLEQAIEIDNKIKQFLIDYRTVLGTRESVDVIVVVKAPAL